MSFGREKLNWLCSQYELWSSIKRFYRKSTHPLLDSYYLYFAYEYFIIHKINYDISLCASYYLCLKYEKQEKHFIDSRFIINHFVLCSSMNKHVIRQTDHERHFFLEYLIWYLKQMHLAPSRTSTLQLAQTISFW